MPKKQPRPRRELIETQGLLDERLLAAVVSKKPVAAAQALLDRGANPLSLDSPPLSEAARAGSLGVLKAMLEALAQVEAGERELNGCSREDFKDEQSMALLDALSKTSSAACVKAIAKRLGWPLSELDDERYEGASRAVTAAFDAGRDAAASAMLDLLPAMKLDNYWLKLALRSANPKAVSALLSRVGPGKALTPGCAKAAFAWACQNASYSADLLPALKAVMPLLEQGRVLWGLSDHPLTQAAGSGQRASAEWILERYGASCSDNELKKAAEAARRGMHGDMAQLIEAVGKARSEMRELAAAIGPEAGSASASAPRIRV